MCLSSVLLPLPDPPRMMKTSPGWTLKLMSCISTLPSYPAVRCSTVMIGSAGMRGSRSNVEQIVDERVAAVDDNQQDDAGDHGSRCGYADGAGAGLRLQAAQAADTGDKDREYRRLCQSGQQVLHIDQAIDFVQETDDRDVEGDHRQRAPEDAYQVGEKRKQRHHQQRREDPG